MAEIVEEQGLQPNGLVLECTLGAVGRNGSVDFASGESMPQKTFTYSTRIKCSLHLWCSQGFVCQRGVVHVPARRAHADRMRLQSYLSPWRLMLPGPRRCLFRYGVRRECTVTVRTDRTTQSLEVHAPHGAPHCVSRILSIRGVRSRNLRSSLRVPYSLQPPVYSMMHSTSSTKPE